jgi:hypothetical protein
VIDAQKTISRNSKSAHSNSDAAVALDSGPECHPDNAAIHCSAGWAAAWPSVLGRFHPSLVHLPIGARVAAFLELAGTKPGSACEAAGFVLHLALATGVVTLFFGILLAYGSGVMRHYGYASHGAVSLLLIELLALSPCPSSSQASSGLSAFRLLAHALTGRRIWGFIHGRHLTATCRPVAEIFPTASAS